VKEEAERKKREEEWRAQSQGREPLTRFIKAARDGVALNKHGRRYRRRSVDSLESALAQIPDELARPSARKSEAERRAGAR
jgi:hypothetical protein